MSERETNEKMKKNIKIEGKAIRNKEDTQQMQPNWRNERKERDY